MHKGFLGFLSSALLMSYSSPAFAGKNTYQKCQEAARTANTSDAGGIWQHFCTHLYTLPEKGWDRGAQYYGSCRRLGLESNQAKTNFCYNFVTDPYTP